MQSWVCFAIVIFSELMKSGCGFYCKSTIVSLIKANAQQCTLAGKFAPVKLGFWGDSCETHPAHIYGLPWPVLQV